MVAAGGREVAGRDHGHAGEDLELDPGARERRAQPPLALLRVRAHVLAEEDRLGAGVLRDPDGLREDVAAPDDERCPTLAQPSVEVVERVEQERDPVRHAERCEDVVVEHEQRDDAFRPLDGGGERRVVVQAQIAGEEHDDGSVPRFPHTWTKGRQGRSQPRR